MNYDAALKNVLQGLSADVLTELTGAPVTQWHNIEFPGIRSLRVDMLGTTADGTPIHIELQSTNDPEMAVRMAEYSLAIYRKLDRFPRQVVLYTGSAPLRMKNVLERGGFAFRYRLIDIREWDAGPLLESSNVEDNVIAILTHLQDGRTAVRRILSRIAACEPHAREMAMSELAILAELRNLTGIVQQEMEKMPLTEDIMDHPIIGPALREGQERGERLSSFVRFNGDLDQFRRTASTS